MSPSTRAVPDESNGSGAARALLSHAERGISRSGNAPVRVCGDAPYCGARRPLARDARLGYPETHCHDSSVSTLRSDQDRVSPAPVPAAILPRQGVWLPFAPVQLLPAPAPASSRVPCRIALRIARRPGSGFCRRTTSRASETCAPGAGNGLRSLACLSKLWGEEIPPVEAALVRASRGSPADGPVPGLSPPLPVPPEMSPRLAGTARFTLRYVPESRQVGAHPALPLISHPGISRTFPIFSA